MGSTPNARQLSFFRINHMDYAYIKFYSLLPAGELKQAEFVCDEIISLKGQHKPSLLIIGPPQSITTLLLPSTTYEQSITCIGHRRIWHRPH